MENYNFDSTTIKKDMEEQKRREEVALARIVMLERELDQKQKLEFEIVQLKDKLKVIENYLQGEEDIYKLMDKIHKKREEEKKGLEELHDFQLMKHKVNQTNEARAQLIEGLAKMLNGPTLIGIKRMGDIHINSFESACKKFPADMRALEPCCSKDVEICNPSWHPTKIIECDGQFEAALSNGYLALGLIERKKSDEKVNKLMEEHKRENEVALGRVLQLETELDQKQKLELEIAHLKGKLKVMELLQGNEDIDKKIEEIHKKMEEDKEGLMQLYNTLLMKEHESNQELNEARGEVIQSLTKLLKGPSLIGIKRMGDLDIKPFETACKKKFPPEDVGMKASELCSSWVGEICDPSWHPFKIIHRNGANEEVIDENDPKLKSLWIEFGDDVQNAVKKALVEMNEYNPSGRYPIAELWNWKEERRAKLKEVLHYIIKQSKTRR